MTLTLARHRLHVNGLYRYEHDWPVSVMQGFSCPFPTGDGLGEIQDFVAELVPFSPNSESTLLPVTWLNGTAYFQARIPAGRVTEVRIRYIQPIVNTGKYFLTTTQPWHRPLFERTNFLPDRDWIITTEPAENAE